MDGGSPSPRRSPGSARGGSRRSHRAVGRRGVREIARLAAWVLRHVLSPLAHDTALKHVATRYTNRSVLSVHSETDTETGLFASWIHNHENNWH